jgi:hypothetical protein
VELTFAEPPPEQGAADVSIGRVRFLVEEAPQERMHSGVRFQLYEGPTFVAEVEVID